MIVQKNVPLKYFTTYQLGGHADYFVHACTRQDIVDAVRYAQDNNLPLLVLGKGANMLIADSGYRGLIIKNDYTALTHESWESVSGTKLHWVRAGSGVSLEYVIRYTTYHGLSGFEHYVMIPSTIGGALWQNLHFLSPDRARTVYISEIVHHVSMLNLVTGNVQMFSREEMQFGYDTSVLHRGNHVVLDAVFQVAVKPRSEIVAVKRANELWRTERHPDVNVDYSCGSVFQKVLVNGEWVAAAKLIDAAGLKGYRSGGAQVSLVHPNFITHTGDASAQDVMNVIRHVQRVVHETSGVSLTPEIRFVGEFV